MTSGHPALRRIRNVSLVLLGLAGVLFVAFLLSLQYSRVFFNIAPALADPYYCWLQENLVASDIAVRPDGLAIVQASAETRPMTTKCDSADDPAIWVHRSEPDKSLIVGTNKRENLSVYSLDGRLLHERPTGGSNNVDVRSDVMLGQRPIVLVGASAPDHDRFDLFELDTDSGQLLDLAGSPVGTRPVGRTSGLCFFRDPMNATLYAVWVDQSGAVEQWKLVTSQGAISAAFVRRIELGSESEGCVADDQNRRVFVAEENAGIWRFNADPSVDPELTLVASTGLGDQGGGSMLGDVEGLGIYAGDAPDAGFLVASDQGNNTYTVFDRKPA